MMCILTKSGPTLLWMRLSLGLAEWLLQGLDGSAWSPRSYRIRGGVMLRSRDRPKMSNYQKKGSLLDMNLHGGLKKFPYSFCIKKSIHSRLTCKWHTLDEYPNNKQSHYVNKDSSNFGRQRGDQQTFQPFVTINTA